jgi:hypothetical protein
MAFLLFGGFLLNKDQVPPYCAWISAASYFNYAYEALAVSGGSWSYCAVFAVKYAKC